MTDSPRPPKPLAPRVVWHRDTGTLSVSVRHRESDGVSSCTSSYMTQLEMGVDRWREYIAAVAAELDRLERAGAAQQIGDLAADLAGRIAEHGGAT